FPYTTLFRSLHDVVDLVEVVDRVVVDQEHQRGADEAAQHLRNPIPGDFPPRKSTAERGAQCDRRIDVRTGYTARGVDRERDGQCPSPRDQQPVARRLKRPGGAAPRPGQGPEHRDDPVAEADQDKAAEELGPVLAERSVAPPLEWLGDPSGFSYCCHMPSSEEVDSGNRPSSMWSHRHGLRGGGCLRLAIGVARWRPAATQGIDRDSSTPGPAALTSKPSSDPRQLLSDRRLTCDPRGGRDYQSACDNCKRCLSSRGAFIGRKTAPSPGQSSVRF